MANARIRVQEQWTDNKGMVQRTSNRGRDVLPLAKAGLGERSIKSVGAHIIRN